MERKGLVLFHFVTREKRRLVECTMIPTQYLDVTTTSIWLCLPLHLQHLTQCFAGIQKVQRSPMQAMPNSFPCGAHLHRMGLRRSNECTLCQRARKQREDDQYKGCGRSDPEKLGHIQSAWCALHVRSDTSVHHHCCQKVQREIAAASPESKGWPSWHLRGSNRCKPFGRRRVGNCTDGRLSPRPNHVKWQIKC